MKQNSKHCDSRKGDMAEFYAVTWLWDNGYEVFKNCGCTGLADLVGAAPAQILLQRSILARKIRQSRFHNHH